MSPDSVTFNFFLFYQYDFVVGLLQGFMILKEFEVSSMPMNQEVIPRGAGTFSRDLTKPSTFYKGGLGPKIFLNQTK